MSSSFYVSRLVRRASRRILVADVLIAGGRWVLWSALVGLALLCLDRLTSLSIPLWAILSCPALALAAVSALAAHRRIDPVETASRVDRSLGLKDRLSTAVALAVAENRQASPDHQEPFETLARLDAERAARDADLGCALPLPRPGRWLPAAIASGVLISTALFMPERAHLVGQSADAGEANADDDSRRDQVVAAIRDAAQQLRDDQLAQRSTPSTATSPHGPVEDADLADALTDRALETLDRLSDQLALTGTGQSGEEEASARDREADADALLMEGSSQLSDLADEAELAAEAAQDQADYIVQQFSGLDKSGGAADDSVAELADALRRGDFDQAADRMRDLSREAPGLSDDAQQDAARRLRELAERMDEARRQERARREQELARDQRALSDRGLSRDAIDDLIDPEKTDEQELRRELEQQGEDRESARRLAQELAQRARRREAQDQADDNVGKVTQEMRRLADSVEQPAEPDEPASPDQQRTAGEDDDAQTPASADPDGNDDPDERNPDGRAGQDAAPDDAQTRDDQQGLPDKPQDRVTDPGDRSPGQQIPDQGPQKQDPATAREDDDTLRQPPDGRAGDDGEVGREPLTGDTDPSGQPRPENEPPGVPDSGRPDPTAPQGPGDAPMPTPGDQQPESGNDQDQTLPTPQEQPVGDGATPQEQPVGGGDTPQEIAKRLSEALRRLGDHQRRARDHQQFSDSMRNEARKLLEELTPEQKEELERWGRQFQQESNQDGESPDGVGGAGRDPAGSEAGDGFDPTEPPEVWDYEVEDLDLRPQGDQDIPLGDRVIAEWFRDQAEDRAGEDGAGVKQTPDNRVPYDRELHRAPAELRRAVRAVERALNEEAIPPRYRRLIKRWADRLPRTLAPPARPADANKAPDDAPGTSPAPRPPQVRNSGRRLVGAEARSVNDGSFCGLVVDRRRGWW